MKLRVLEGAYHVLQLPPTTPLPSWVLSILQTSPFLSITSTAEELSIVCPASALPENVNDIKAEKDFVCFQIEGPLDFSLIGIIASLSSILAEEKISTFVVSTFNTDYILVRKDNLEKAVSALTAKGHVVN